ncbi:PP2C family protein-serine/threonine phosphatase, partial [Microbacterium terrae]
YWLVINLGDSRTYRLSGGELEQVSVDHSVVQELVDSGQLDAAAAGRDSRRNVITRAIGGGSDAEPDYWLLPAERGDRLLICSDGLSSELDSPAIHAIVTAESDPGSAARRLVHEAMVCGGRDNITAIVVDAVWVRTKSDDGSDHDTMPVGGVVDTADGDTLPRAVAAGGF